MARKYIDRGPAARATGLRPVALSPSYMTSLTTILCGELSRTRIALTDPTSKQQPLRSGEQIERAVMPGPTSAVDQGRPCL